MALPWGLVKSVFCPECGKELNAFKKNKVSPHTARGEAVNTGDCSGSGKKPNRVKGFDSKIYDN
jgi:hypothetical protein